MTVTYLDHTVLITPDLDDVADRLGRLGFTLSPRAPHLLADRPGGPLVPTCTANRCVYFGRSFIEVLGIVDATAPDPWHARRLAAEARGLLLTLGCYDIAGTEARLRAEGLAGSGIRALERPLRTPDGIRTVRASSVRVDPAQTPEGGLQVTQHHTPALAHQRHYLDHPNGARDLTAVTLVVDDDARDEHVDRYARVLGIPARTDGARATFTLGAQCVDIVTGSCARDLLPGIDLPRLPVLAAHTVTVTDPAAARRLIEANDVPTRDTPEGFLVDGPDAGGIPLVFAA